MSYVLRDRPDGQVEIIFQRPTLIGIFPDRELARRVCTFLQDDELPPVDAPPVFARATEDVREVESKSLEELAGLPPEPALRPAQRATRALVVVPDKPSPTALIVHVPPNEMTEEQIDRAFARIAEGEKVSAVARGIGVPFGTLRGMWANHCRKVQKHLAGGGQQPCSLCQTPFTPSLSHPETCARCSRD